LTRHIGTQTGWMGFRSNNCLLLIGFSVLVKPSLPRYVPRGPTPCLECPQQD